MPADLATLTRELDRLSTSAHTPEDGLATARAILTAMENSRLYQTLPKFEAEMLESHGYHDDAQAWWKKVKQLDDDVRADVLRLATCVDELRPVNPSAAACACGGHSIGPSRAHTAADAARANSASRRPTTHRPS